MELAPLTRQGIDWIARLKSGSATELDLKAWRSWQAQSPAHAEAFREALRLRRRLQAAGQALLEQQQAPAVSHRMSRRGLIGGALAASTAGWLALRPPLGLWPSVGDVVADLRADYSTAIGEQRQIALGTDRSLTLNTQTRLAWRTIDGDDALALMSGEALFAIEQGAARPFTISAGAGVTRIEAGRMNIRTFDESVWVTCLEGRLQVNHGGTSVTLDSRQQVAYDDAGLRPVIAIDPLLATAWQAGLLIFRNEPLRNVVDEINRYRRGKIVLANAALERRLVNGTFHLGQMDGAPLQMQQLLGAHVRTLPGGIVILS